MGPNSPVRSPQTLVKPRPSADRPLVIGLLGGIAAGKSTAARIFAEHGFRVIDADLVARAVVAESEVKAQIRLRFGPGVFDGAGDLRRSAMAEEVFGNPAARRDLEAIIHPRVRELILKDLAAARGARESVVLDVPLLLERGLIDECDHNVFLDADEAARRERAGARGWSEVELAQREASQTTLQAKRDRCEFTVRTDGTIEDTRHQVAAVVAKLVADR